MTQNRPGPSAHKNGGQTGESRPIGWFWPRVTSEAGARRAMLFGFWAAIAVAIFHGLIFVAFAAGKLAGLPTVRGIERGDLAMPILTFSGPFALAAALVAWGLWRYSRMAAFVAFGLGFVWIVHQLREHLGFGGGLDWNFAIELSLPVAFLAFSVPGVRGVLAHHRHFRKTA